MPLLIFNYSMFGLLTCIYEPFWQKVSAESDTQVIVKACGPLVVITSVSPYKFTLYPKLFKDIETKDENAVVIGLAPEKFQYNILNQAFR